MSICNGYSSTYHSVWKVLLRNIFENFKILGGGREAFKTLEREEAVNTKRTQNYNDTGIQ